MIVNNDFGDHLLDPDTDDAPHVDDGVDSLYTEGSDMDNNSSEEPDQDGDTESPTYEDALTEYLASRGIKDGTTLSFEDDNGDIVETKFSELSREEQMNVLNELSRPNLSQSELEAVQYLRQNNATLNDVINHFSKQAVDKYIQQSAPQKEYSIDEYSDEELYVADLKAKYPDMSNDELEADLTLAMSNAELFSKKADIIRNNYKQLEDRRFEEARQAEEYSYNMFRNSLHDSLANFEDISLDYTDPSSDSLTVEDSEKEAIYSYLMSPDENGVSQFAKDVNDPNILVDLAWYRLFGKDAIAGISQYWKGVVKDARKSEARAQKEHAKTQRTHVIPSKEDFSKKQDKTLTSLWDGKI